MWDGTYQLTGLTTGDYTVQFGTQDGVYASEWWNNKDTRETANPVSVSEGQTTGGVNAELALRPIQPGKIAGTITGPGGASLAAGTTGTVSVFDSAGDEVATKFFSQTGVFEVKGLEPGPYKLRVWPDDQSVYAREWWQDAATLEEADPITVLSTATTGVNPQLDVPAGIGGTVTGPGGAALAPDTEGSVDVYDASGEYIEGSSFSADGTFAVKGLPAGSYTVRFSTWGDNYLEEWWQNASTQASATPVPVTTGQKVVISPQLDPAGAITGTVTGPSGASLLPGTYGFIRAYDSTGTQVGYASFEADPQEGAGAFRIAGLTTGAYKLRVISSSYRYRTQWWNLDLSSAAADPVNVVLGQTTSGINPALQSTSSVPGVPTGLAGSAGDGQVALTWAGPGQRRRGADQRLRRPGLRRRRRHVATVRACGQHITVGRGHRSGQRHRVRVPGRRPQLARCRCIHVRGGSGDSGRPATPGASGPATSGPATAGRSPGRPASGNAGPSGGGGGGQGRGWWEQVVRQCEPGSGQGVLEVHGVQVEVRRGDLGQGQDVQDQWVQGDQDPEPEEGHLPCCGPAQVQVGGEHVS